MWCVIYYKKYSNGKEDDLNGKQLDNLCLLNLRDFPKQKQQINFEEGPYSGRECVCNVEIEGGTLWRQTNQVVSFTKEEETETGNHYF